jgi:HSP20 family protein
MTTIVRRRNADYSPIFNSFFNEFFANEGGQTEQSNYIPPVNIKETEDEFELTFIAPGMQKKNFEILLDNDTLSVSGEVEEKKKDDESTFSKMEYTFRSFKRSFTLPIEKINTEKIDAKYENGILHVIIPKKEEAKPQPAKSFKVK